MATPYLIKCRVEIDRTTANKMEKDLNGRFSNIAKRFGSAMKTSIKAMGWGTLIAIGGAIVANMMNPLKEVNERLKTTLAMAQDAVDRSQQFGSSIANYSMVRALASSKGLDEESLVMMLMRWQEKINESKEGKNPILNRYKNDTDIVYSMMKGIANIQTMDKATQAKMLNEIFGIRFVGRMNAFVQQSDLGKRLDYITKGFTPSQIESKTKKAERIEDTASLLQARREFSDMIKRYEIVNQDMVKRQDEIEKIRLEKERRDLATYEQRALVQEKIDRTLNEFNRLVNLIFTKIPDIERFLESIGGKSAEVIKTVSDIKSAVFASLSLLNPLNWRR